MSFLHFIVPIIFIFLLVSLPILGFIIGWKRALFWSGGNFIGYFVGLIIWIAAGSLIGKNSHIFDGLIIGISSPLDIDALKESLFALFFFGVWLASWNITLIINYFAWYRKVIVLKNINGSKKLKNRWINLVNPRKNLIKTIAGSFSFVLLLQPTMFESLSTISIVITTPRLINGNKFIGSMYGVFYQTNKVFNWMSYYKTTHIDYLSTLAFRYLNNNEVFYRSLEGVYVKENCLNAIITLCSDGIKSIFSTNKDPVTADAELLYTVNNFTSSWTSLIKVVKAEMWPIFNSPNFCSWLSKEIVANSIEQVNIYDGNICFFIEENNLFDRAMKSFTNNEPFGGEYFNETLPVPSTTPIRNSFVDNVKNLFDLDDSLTYEQKEKFVYILSQVCKLIIA